MLRVVHQRIDLDNPLLEPDAGASLQFDLNRHGLGIHGERQADLVAGCAGAIKRHGATTTHCLIALRHAITDDVERLADVWQAAGACCGTAHKRAVSESIKAEQLNKVFVSAVECTFDHSIDVGHVNADILELAIGNELGRGSDLLRTHDAERCNRAIGVIDHHEQIALVCAGCTAQGHPGWRLEQVTRQQ